MHIRFVLKNNLKSYEVLTSHDIIVPTETLHIIIDSVKALVICIDINYQYTNHNCSRNEYCLKKLLTFDMKEISKP